MSPSPRRSGFGHGPGRPGESGTTTRVAVRFAARLGPAHITGNPIIITDPDVAAALLELIAAQDRP